MKNLITLSALLLIGIFVSAQNITIGTKGAVLNKTTVSENWQVSNFITEIGAPERNREGFNKTHTYDKQGMVVFEKMINKQPTGTLSEFQMYYHVATPTEVTPTGIFSGTLTFNDLKLTKAISYEELLKHTEGWTLGKSYSLHSYRYTYPGISVFFQFNDDETELYKVSIGEFAK